MRTGKICGAVWEAQAVNRHIQGGGPELFCNVTLLKWRIGLDCLADPHHMIRLHQMNPKANQIHIFRYTKIFHKKNGKSRPSTYIYHYRAETNSRIADRWRTIWITWKKHEHRCHSSMTVVKNFVTCLKSHYLQTQPQP